MEIQQNFTQGINRTMSREQFLDPTFFYTLQNCRVLQSGNVGEVVRINGYEQILPLLNFDTIYDVIEYNNNGIVIYKDGADFKVTVFDDTGTEVATLSYQDEDSDYVSLKKFDTTVFIAPHNKLIYKEGATWLIEDFISHTPKVDNISLDDTNAVAASGSITIDDTIIEGTAGEPAKSVIIVRNNNVPAGTSEDITVTIGPDTTGPITIDYSDSAVEIAEKIYNELDGDVNFSDWSFEYSGTKIFIEATTVGTSFNNLTVKINGQFVTTSDTRGQETKGPSPFNRGSFRDGVGGYDDPNTVEHIINASSMFSTTSTYGGKDSEANAGSINVTLNDQDISVYTVDILSTDTTSEIATKIYNALNIEPVTRKYDLSLATNTITINAVAKGVLYNTTIGLAFNIDGETDVKAIPPSKYTIDDPDDGLDSLTTGTLDPYTQYWYCARFRFIDGHITKTCTPRLIESGPNGFIQVEFEITTDDLNGEPPLLQIFRKKEDEDFYFIEEIDLAEETITAGIYTYQDTGRSKIEPLDNKTNVWSKSHKEQEIIENRLVKANITYFDEKYSFDQADFTIGTTDSTDKDVAPYNSKLQVYVRPEYTDGTTGYHELVGDINIQDVNKKITIDQTAAITGTEKDISELSFYGKYLPFGKRENFTFGAGEISTPNLSSIANPDVFPINTKVLFGFKYITITENGAIYARISGWNVEGYERIFGVWFDSGPSSLYTQDEVEIGVFGHNFNYVKVAENLTTDIIHKHAIYKLDIYESLSEAVSTESLKIKLTSSNVNSLSSGIGNDRLYELEVGVIGIDDKSEGQDSFIVEKIELGTGPEYVLYPADDSRLYLVLEESNYDEIDNSSLNRYEYLKSDNDDNNPTTNNFIGKGGETFPAGFNEKTMSWSLINFQLRAGDEATKRGEQRPVNTENLKYFVQDWNYSKYNLINRNLNTDEQVIFLGAKDNEISGPITLETTGFKYEDREALLYSNLAEYSIIATLVTKNQFNFNQLEFNNQLIWSNELLNENYFSGGRTFSVANYYNVPTEYGEIIDIVSFDTGLMVFCERGVGRALVGETLTTQKSGEVFVNSSNFITRFVWVLENISDIQKDTIIKKGNNIYFANGEDVYEIGSQGVQKISEQFLNLDYTHEFSISSNDKYDEIRLNDLTDGESWVFNTNYRQWYGPITYTPNNTIEIGDNIYSSLSTSLIKEDVTNTFAGTAFDSIIESVGNDTEVGFYDKHYRKFYISADNEIDSTFYYGKDTNMDEQVQLNSSNAQKKIGDWHIGIKGSQGNAKKIYWKLQTTNADFRLTGFTTRYSLNRRR